MATQKWQERLKAKFPGFKPITAEEMGRRMFDGGASSWVELLPGDIIRKAVPAWESRLLVRTCQIKDMRNEVAVYKHLPQGHPRFLPMLSSYDTDVDVGFDMPYMKNGSLRTYLQKHHVDDNPDGTPMISGRLRARWAVEIADGIGFLHRHGVIHCDIKPHNVLLDDTLGIQIIDMAGSKFGDRPSTCCESIRFYMPRDKKDPEGNVVTDLFAVGMSLFEIVTGAQPFGEIKDHMEIIRRYDSGEFPSLQAVTVSAEEAAALPGMKKFITKFMSPDPQEVGNTGDAPANISPAARARAPTDASGSQILFAGTIQRTWHGEFASAADLLAALAEEIRATFNAEDVAYIEHASGLPLQADNVGRRLDRTENGDPGENAAPGV